MKQLSELIPPHIDTLGEKKLTRLEWLELQVNDYNASKGDLKGYNCSVCNNKGWVEKVAYNEFYDEYQIVLQRCECMKKRKIIEKVKQSGLGEYMNKNFDDFKVVDRWLQPIKAKAIDYVKNGNKNWFVMLGQVGSGKTMLSCIVATTLLKQGKNVMYITWTDFISKLKRDMMSDNTQNVSEYLDYLKNVEVLFIDELLKKYNETDLKYIIEIINYRYMNDLVTIITSEKLIPELLDIDEATFSRVVEKSSNYMINISRERNKNYRLRNL